jgi:hypothetical protein
MLKTAVPLIIGIVSIVAIYYIYQALFATTTMTPKTIFGPSKKATTELVTPATSISPLVEGGEYTVSFWMYVNDWNYRKGQAKHVLSIGSPLGGTTGFETLAVYLSPHANTLHIRTQNEDLPTSVTSATPHLTPANMTALFSASQTPSAAWTQVGGSDIAELDMQRWVNVTIALNGRTVDVYLDGKLARSTVTAGFYRVPATSYQLHAFYAGGYGGYMSGLTTFDYALNPEEVHRHYSAGPHGRQSIIDWLRSIFSPSEETPAEYPL